MSEEIIKLAVSSQKYDEEIETLTCLLPTAVCKGRIITPFTINSYNAVYMPIGKFFVFDEYDGTTIGEFIMVGTNTASAVKDKDWIFALVKENDIWKVCGYNNLTRYDFLNIPAGLDERDRRNNLLAFVATKIYLITHKDLYNKQELKIDSNNNVQIPWRWERQ